VEGTIPNMYATYLLYFLDMDVLLCRYRGSVVCMCFLRVQSTSITSKQMY